MKKKIDLRLQLNKKTIARLDPNAMKKIKGGAAATVSTTSDKNSNGGTACSCVCCAGFPA
jgi:hypothetical protein